MPVTHYRNYSRSGLQQEFIKAGFDVYLSKHLDSLGFFENFVYKLIGNRQEGDNCAAIYNRCFFSISHFLDRTFPHILGKNDLICGIKRWV